MLGDLLGGALDLHQIETLVCDRVALGELVSHDGHELLELFSVARDEGDGDLPRGCLHFLLFLINFSALSLPFRGLPDSSGILLALLLARRLLCSSSLLRGSLLLRYWL